MFSGSTFVSSFLRGFILYRFSFVSFYVSSFVRFVFSFVSLVISSLLDDLLDSFWFRS